MGNLSVNFSPTVRFKFCQVLILALVISGRGIELSGNLATAWILWGTFL